MRSASINFVFIVLLGLIAILARAAALTTSGPWFTPEISGQVYSITMVGSVFLAIGLLVLASLRVAHLEQTLLSLEIRTTILSGVTGLDPQVLQDSMSVDSPNGPNRLDDVMAGLDDGLRDIDPTVQVELRSPIRVAQENVAARAGAVANVQTELIKRFRAVESSRDRVWWTVAGPLFGCVIFLAVSAAMLPGSQGFAVANFQLNTMFVLFLAYGWWLLLAWSLLSVLTLPSAARTRRVFRPRLWEKVE